jgi:lysophospholipase L1-like esterase
MAEIWISRSAKDVCREMRRALTVLGFVLYCTAPSFSQAGQVWVGSWAAAPGSMPALVIDAEAQGRTYRSVVHLSAGGSAIRVDLTNESGAMPLVIGSVHVAISAGAGGIQVQPDRVLTFDGRQSVTIPAGAHWLSDPLQMQVAPLSDLVLSVFLPGASSDRATCHLGNLSMQYIFSGNALAAASAEKAIHLQDLDRELCYLRRIDVRSNLYRTGTAIVAFGDSLTAGGRSTPDANRRWTDRLAARLQKEKNLVVLGILNEGIGGNALLHTGGSPNALSRFDRDVLSQANVKYLILDEGINDLRAHAHAGGPDGPLTEQEIISAYQLLAFRAHEHGMRVIGATIMPHKGDITGYSEEIESLRQNINVWIRTTSAFDGLIDFDRAMRDPRDPAALLPAYDSGDHLHPNDSGYDAMGDAIDLSLFR